METDSGELVAARRAALVNAEARAMELFERIEEAQLIAPNRTERDVEDGIYALAKTHFGVEKHWHKRVVRAGANTVTIGSDNPPVSIIAPDDIVYVDLGPVFGEWEADVGRSYVLGSDPLKQALVTDLPAIFAKVQAHFNVTPEITGAALYAFAQQAALDAGWIFGGIIAGHIVAEFPHARIPGDKNFNRINPHNTLPLRNPDTLGRERHWILEIHLVDKTRSFGRFL